jgi:hypothetical protein
VVCTSEQRHADEVCYFRAVYCVKFSRRGLHSFRSQCIYAAISGDSTKNMNPDVMLGTAMLVHKLSGAQRNSCNNSN